MNVELSVRKLQHGLQDLAKMKFLYTVCRGISTCNVKFVKYAKREGKFITKILKEEQTKRKWYISHKKAAVSPLGASTQRTPVSSRRNTVLNKLFMRYITDLMATGEIAPSILGRGIEISRVNITPDFHQINVFWAVHGEDKNPGKIEKILAEAAGPLRHELSQLRLMGAVPIIQFVRDKQYIVLKEIDQRLSTADFGNGFVPSDPILRLQRKFTQVWDEIDEKSEQDGSETIEGPLPEMRHDVMGLDHARIMAKICGSMDKSRAAFQNRSLNISNIVPRKVEISSTVTEYLSVKQRRDALAMFLNKRQHMEKKSRKREREMIENPDLYLDDQENFDDADDDLDIGIDADEIQR